MFVSDLRSEAPKIEPSSWFPLDPNYCGKWLVAGDLFGDGSLEFVSARTESQAVVTIAAYRQNGSVLWTYGKPGAGSADISSDIPLQIYDINNDGKSEVICGIKNFILVLEGATGKELTRYPLPQGLEVADCITFANLSNSFANIGTQFPTHKSDIIIKNRYLQLWAYTSDWRFLWTWQPKKGLKTCHHPTPFDFNNDGFDEILVGNELLDHKGKTLWTIKSKHAGKKGHLDCAQVVTSGHNPEDVRIVFTYCGAKYLAMMNGKGKVLWEQKGHHFESIDIGFFNRDYPRPQFYADIDHSTYGKMQGMFIDFEGRIIGTCEYDTGRFHRCVDWNGDGLDEVVVSPMLALVNGNGQKIGEFQFKSNISMNSREMIDLEDPERFLVSVVDLTGKGNGDIVIHSEKAVNIYLNPSNLSKTQKRFDSMNFTLY
jgi:hypothetical protein